jgi:hypothetical protein
VATKTSRREFLLASGSLLLPNVGARRAYGQTNGTLRVFIDPQTGSNANAGTQHSPWADFTNLADGSLWDEAFVRRGSVMTVSARTVLASMTGKWIGVYGDESEPAPEIRCYTTLPPDGWIEVSPDDGSTPRTGTNLWAYRFPYAHWNPPAFVNFGALGAYGIRRFFWTNGYPAEGGNSPEFIEPGNVPAAYGEYDYRSGSGESDPPTLLVYAVGNPVDYYGVIYCQLGSQPALLIRDGTDITVQGLKVAYSYALVRAEGTANNGCANLQFLDIEAELAYAAVIIRGAHDTGWVDGFLIDGLVARTMLGDTIQPHDYIRNGHIRNCDIRTSGLVESAGAIYVGNCFAPRGQELHIYRNYIEDQRFGNYWPHDGGSIMTDSNSQNVWVYQNLMRNSFAGLASNSGRPGCRWFSNITIGVDRPFHESDTGHYNAAETYVCNNTFLDCQMYRHHVLDAPIEAVAAVRFASTLPAPAGRYRVYNNIITCVPSTNTNAFACEPVLDAAGCVQTAHNVVHGHALGFSVWGNERGLDASDIVANPLVDENYLPAAASPARSAGIDWWTELGMTPVDYHGRPLRAGAPDVGAIQNEPAPSQPEPPAAPGADSGGGGGSGSGSGGGGSSPLSLVPLLLAAWGVRGRK